MKAPRSPYNRRLPLRATRASKYCPLGLREPGEHLGRDAMKARLYELAERVSKMKTWGWDLSNVQLKIRMRGKDPNPGTSGNSWPISNKITLFVGTAEAEAIGVLIHEYAHHAMFRLGRTEEGHTALFSAFERQAFEEYLGEPLRVTKADAQTYGGTGLKHHRYEQLGAFSRQLRKILAEQRRRT